MSDPIWSALQNTLTVPYTDLQVATSNFADENILGKGGYGVVYVGEWKHTKIAVKRFMSTGTKGAQIQRERLRQSLQELKTLAKFRHDNILPLYAFSLEGPEPCLVYQYMSNGSLEDRLLCRHGTPPLSWTQKREIAEGTACGLHFLHSIGSVPIIHGDVKSANILLDRHFEPKLGDFGLSRDGKVEADADEKSPLIASHVKGTLAYLPPEFITNKILSTKLDVYSFGIVLLEICTGMRAFMDSRVPPSLAEYCISARDARKCTPERSSLAWVEADADEKSPLIASHVKGTLAYLPPEFITNKILSTKLDVYSFGIVLLEICTGMRAFMDSRVPPSLAEYCISARDARKCTPERSSLAWVEALMDKRTPCVRNQGVVVAWCDGVMYLGLKCADKDRHLRPSFPQIVEALSNLPSIA
ncbi:kinase domain protein, partial [Ostertagia ostertagi]